VKACPSSDNSYAVDYKTTDTFVSGTSTISLATTNTISDISTLANGGTVIFKYGTVLYFDKICGPDASFLTNLGPVSDLIKNTMGTFEKFIADITRAYYVLVAAFGAAVIIGLLYMLFLRLCVGVLVFVTIMTIILG